MDDDDDEEDDDDADADDEEDGDFIDDGAEEDDDDEDEEEDSEEGMSDKKGGEDVLGALGQSNDEPRLQRKLQAVKAVKSVKAKPPLVCTTCSFPIMQSTHSSCSVGVRSHTFCPIVTAVPWHMKLFFIPLNS